MMDYYGEGGRRLDHSLEVDHATLDRIVNSLSLTEDCVVEYNNNTYGIFYDPVACERIALSTPSSLYTADIYIWKDLPELLRKLVLYHEILEADLAFGQGMEFDDAHRTSTALEDVYARKLLNYFEYRRYRRMREDVALINEAFQAFEDQQESKERYEKLRERFLREHRRTQSKNKACI